MNNIYSTNFERLRETYLDIFEPLERAFKNWDIDFYLIGAQSRDIWTDHLNLKKRTTSDIDFCVFIKEWDTWNEFIQYLIHKEGFEKDKMEPYRFHKKHSIDLIPFGAIAQDGTVVLDNPPMELSVYGCKEVTEEAVVVTKHFKVVTLAGLCILKLIAYSERPEYRSKDLEDYFFIVVNYYQIAGEELFNGQYDDLIEGDFEVNIASARMLGRNMALVLNKNETLKNSVINILMQQLQGFTEPEIDQMYKVRDEDNNLVVKLKLVFETIKGIKDIVHDPN